MALRKLGHTQDAIKESVCVSRKMSGYVTFPWLDEAGRPLTLYGKHPDPKHEPKTRALPNPKDDNKPWLNTKRSPLYFDRALRAECKEVVLVEGVTDAALPQVRGDPRETYKHYRRGRVFRR
jgi:putative DNA primase/helicase